MAEDNVEQNVLVRALENTLTTRACEKALQIWKLAFATGMHKMIVNDSAMFQETALNILDDDRVSKAELTSIEIRGICHYKFFEAISGIPSVKSLSIEPFKLQGDPKLANVFHMLDLKALEIRCPERPNPEDCIFRSCATEPELWESFLDMLKSECKNVESISVCCTCSKGTAQMGQDILAVINAIPNPSSIRLTASSFIAKDILPCLPRVDSVQFFLSGDRNETTRALPEIPVHLKGVHIKRAKLYDLLALRSLGDLEEIRLEVLQDSELGLDNVSMEKVESLHISGSPDAFKARNSCYYRIKTQTIFSAVNRAPRLQELCVVNCKVSLLDLCPVLMVLGNRLKRFVVSILGQKECPSQRLLELTKAVANYNHEIRKFDFVEAVTEEDAILRLLWGTETFTTYDRIFSELTSAREKLRTNNLRLDQTPVIHQVQRLRPERGMVREMRRAYRVFED